MILDPMDETQNQVGAGVIVPAVLVPLLVVLSIITMIVVLVVVLTRRMSRKPKNPSTDEVDLGDKVCEHYYCLLRYLGTLPT